MAFTITTASRNLLCDAFVDSLDTGTGTQADLQMLDNTVAIATIDLGTTAFGAASATTAGVAKMTAASPYVTSTNTGTLDTFKLRNQSNVAICTGIIGTTTQTMTISNTSISSGDKITLTAMTVTMPASAV